MTKQQKRQARSNLRPIPLRRHEPAVLHFSPTAWRKLVFLRDMGPTEVGGFGITPADDPMFVEDFILVGQEASACGVVFDDQAVAEFFEDQVDAVRQPSQFARIWIHTHPGHSATPSDTDEETFNRVFGPCDYAMMVILARGGQTTGRLQFNAGPKGCLPLEIEVNYSRPFDRSDEEAWEAEYKSTVKPIKYRGLWPTDELVVDEAAWNELDPDQREDLLDEWGYFDEPDESLVDDESEAHSELPF